MRVDFAAKMRIGLGALILLASASRCAPSSLTEILQPVRNAGFEQASDGWRPDAWDFHISGGADAACAVDSSTAHSGRRSLRIWNASGMAPHVYGRLLQRVAVLPATTYVLCAWVKGEQVGEEQHFTDWRSYDLHLPWGTFDWTRVSTTFVTKPDQTSLDIGLNIVNRARNLWLDDVSLTPRLNSLKSKQQGVRGAFWLPQQVVGDGQSASLRVLLQLPAGFRGAALFTVTAGSESLLQCRRPVLGGDSEIKVKWATGAAAVSMVRAGVSVLDRAGRIIALGEAKVKKISPAVLRRRLDDIRAGLDALRAEISAARQAGIAVDYPVVTQTVVEHFLEWTQEDVRRGELVRADYAVDDMLRSLKRARSELRAYRKRPSLAPEVARYVTSDIEISGVSFIADVQRDGKRTRGPVFFCGYGHFGQVRRDIEIFPDYGVNIIQVEFGPNSVLTSENEVSNAPVEEFLGVLDRAAKSNIAVNLLLSPHYFPAWAIQKWPHLARCKGGFINYCIDAPEAKQVIEKFLRHVIPQLRGKPALHSLCLSNEPIYVESRDCEHTRRMWRQYLRNKHGDLASMNRTLGTSYSSFEDAPIPAAREFESPLFYDWCVFNQQRFSGWHKWMADIIHEIAPEIPVHAKIMPTIWNRNDIAYGVDPEQFCALSQINGNDCWIGFPGEDNWANNWHTQNRFYDLLRSLRKQPIFNSENHISADRSTHYYPPEHFRMALWQGAIHGQGATTIWVWERTYDVKSDFYGNVMHRPGCAEAVGRTCLDLMRLAPEVTALQNAPAPVAILYSVASIVDRERYLSELFRAYEGLNFTGVKIDFISERQVQEGGLAKYRLLVVPSANRVAEPTFERILEFARAGRAVALVGEALRKDEYGRPRAGNRIDELVRLAVSIEDGRPGPWLRLAFRDLLRGAGLPDVECVDAAKGEPAWGVEWLSVRHDGSLLINAVNLTKQPVSVRFSAKGKPVAGLVDLFSGKARRQPITLQPLELLLLRAKRF